ncbi:MAG: hypothetical protein P8M30_19335 [Planctomycetaceae bacterium]|jgi:hypothetical protein|nr:hypothetical protein [Planctomycetaceae bacterium]
MQPSVARLILTLFFVSISIQVSPLSAQENPAAQQIRKLITPAAAMRRADLERIAQMNSLPDPDQFEDYSLTLLLFTYKFDTQTDQLKLLTNDPFPPSELVAETNRGFGNYPLRIATAPVSAIQQDRITKVTCKVDGNKATGVVSFKVPGMYAGQVSYIAERKDNRWHITDLMMSDLDLHLVRGNGGLWKEKE